MSASRCNVELAKSNRSLCKKCEENIEKDDVRFGEYNEHHDEVGNFVHLRCFKVPRDFPGVDELLSGPTIERVTELLHSGLPTLLELPVEKQGLVLTHFQNPTNYEPTVVPITLPLASHHDARQNAFSGRVFVATGKFPNAGISPMPPTGLNQGKTTLTGFIESFQGVVKDGINKATTHLVVGHEPGKTKMAEAGRRGIPLVTLEDLVGAVKVGGKDLPPRGEAPRGVQPPPVEGKKGKKRQRAEK